jgi:inorganic pyrophosphatase
MKPRHEFWKYLEQLIVNNDIIIDRPKGSCHPQYPDFIYPLDYGYLEKTRTSDGDGIDVWVGTKENNQLNALLCTVDLQRNDIEVKLLLGCDQDDISTILKVSNFKTMRAMLVEKNDRL